MLSQHLITQPVFDALFAGHAFSSHNPVSLVMQRMVDALESSNLDTETADLESFYAGVRRSVTGITDAAGKQTTIKRLYEKFFTGAFRNTSDRLGIVYTPNEIVDFILRSADELSRDHFGAGLTDEGVHILDPFTGTGTFIVRLLQSGLIELADLARKFRHELHANEIVLLAYYVAAVNIEATYNAITPEESYEPFPGIVLTDTFQSTEDNDRYDDHGIFGDNNQRVKDQNALDIRIIVGNPPYSMGQNDANDNNQNVKYVSLDRRIAETYGAGRGRGGNNSLYDSYIRAIRWASDRIKDRGIIGFVTNGGFLDGNTADGLRLTLQSEFTDLYILNLRGNARTAGEQRRKERDGVFGEGSKTTVVISFLVKNPDRRGAGQIHYRDIGDYLTRGQKLALVEQYATISGVPWTEVSPNEHGDWINQRTTGYETFAPVGAKHGSDSPDATLFGTYSRGLETGRDAWIYNYSAKRLSNNVTRTISEFNTLLKAYEKHISTSANANKKAAAEAFYNPDPSEISWTLSLKNRLVARRPISYDSDAVTTAVYRPFNKVHGYFSRPLNHIQGQNPSFFPAGARNFGFYLTAPGAGHPFSVLAVDALPDLALWGSGSGQFFPRYVYNQGLSGSMLDGLTRVDRQDNITATTLARYRALYGAEVSADDVFYAVYGLLHSPDYREQFAADLKKMLPRIPDLAEPTDFRAFTHAGRALSELHLGYESVDPYPVQIRGDGSADLRVTKMRFAGKAGKWTARPSGSLTR